MPEPLAARPVYQAGFELGDRSWRVAAATVRAPAADAVPLPVREAVRRGVLPRLAVRFTFSAGQLDCAILLPVEASVSTGIGPAELLHCAELDWCDRRDSFDALQSAVPAAQCWLNPRGLVSGNTPIALSATLASRWSELRAASAEGSVVYQINAVNCPVDAERERRLRKLVFAVSAQAAEGRLPQRVANRQLALLEQRIHNHWLLDELVATELPGVVALLADGLLEQARAEGQPMTAADMLEPGDFTALLQSGLDSACFMGDDDHAQASRCWRVDQFLELLARGRSAADPGSGAALTAHWDVFISHASDDAAAALSICGQLEALGLRSWMAPRDIAPGAHYAESIIDALERSAAVVVLLSPAALRSPHVLREIERAVSLRRTLLPVRLVDVQAQGALAYLLSGCQWLDRWRQHDSVTAQQLASALPARAGALAPGT